MAPLSSPHPAPCPKLLQLPASFPPVSHSYITLPSWLLIPLALSHARPTSLLYGLVLSWLAMFALLSPCSGPFLWLLLPLIFTVNTFSSTIARSERSCHFIQLRLSPANQSWCTTSSSTELAPPFGKCEKRLQIFAHKYLGIDLNSIWVHIQE